MNQIAKLKLDVFSCFSSLFFCPALFVPDPSFAHSLSLPSLCSVCPFPHPPPPTFLPPPLRPSLPGCPQPRGLTSWPGCRICQHIFSSLAVRNVHHRFVIKPAWKLSRREGGGGGWGEGGGRRASEGEGPSLCLINHNVILIKKHSVKEFSCLRSEPRLPRSSSPPSDLGAGNAS